MVKIRDELPLTETGSIDADTWVERILSERPQHEKDVLLNAVKLSAEHGEVGLRLGLQTAAVLITLEPDIATLIAAVLYYPTKNEKITLADVETSFGHEVSQLIAGLIEITTRSQKMQGHPTKAQHDNLRRMFLAVVEDVRVVLIKLAERIIVIREKVAQNDAERIQFALEARDIYAPLANRLGIAQIKWELEDLAFRNLEPEAYKHIAHLLHEKRIAREAYVNKVILQVQAALAQEHIDAEVTGRVKHIYSIWRKMIRKNLNFQDIYDVRAIRILVPDIRDCYGALGVVHALWQHIPKEFDDYIATPKENGYRSLHTAVVGPEGRIIEIQIRTFQMHQEAELGVAAHWIYKEGGRVKTNYQKKLNALRQVIDVSDETLDSDAREHLLQEILEDRVYVFTPQGEVVDLPLGATPLDFAYYIHTDLGHHCRGAKVNGSIVPLNYPLNSGEQVEILSIKHGVPSRDWLNTSLGYLKTARARSKVHNWFKRQARDENLVQGREMLEKEFKRLGLDLTGIGNVLGKLNIKSLDDLYAAIGGGDVRIAQVVNVFQQRSEPTDINIEDLVNPSKRGKTHVPSEITIQGVGNLLCHFGGCCKPLPGDPIVGYITLGRGVTIHRQDCVNVYDKMSAEHRLIQVEWGESDQNLYPVDLRVRAYDRQGLIRDITSILSNEKVNVVSIHTHTNKDNNIAEIIVTIEISDLNGLMVILNKIMQLPNILEAERVHEKPRG